MLTPFHVRFAELHVVSDLHLGGAEGFQIFCEGKALAGHIRSLIQPDGPPRCLVINGDFVDFLAEAPARHFDPLDAQRKLERIAADKAFAPVFEALADYLAAPNAWLGVVLGNHDVELALPWVRERLLQLLSGGQPERRGRCLFSLVGEGLLLEVGGISGRPATVMCVHGNEVDSWNVVDHEAVRQIGRDALRDRRIDEDWIPNAGSRMVIEVMNELKSEFAFVDLLKPETEAVLPILLALKPAVLARLNRITAALARQALDGGRIRMGWLGDDAPPPQPARAAPPRPPRANLALISSPPPPGPALSDALLDRAEERLAQQRDPMELLDADGRRDYLGYVGAAYYSLRGNPVEALRQALERLDKDLTFEVLQPDPTYLALHERVSTNIDFLIAGHTHLARAIEREPGRAYYLNSGTWARVFRLDSTVRNEPTRFDTLYQGLKTRDITKLDGLDGLLRVAPHVAVVYASGDGVVGELRQVDVKDGVAKALEHTRWTRR